MMRGRGRGRGRLFLQSDGASAIVERKERMGGTSAFHEFDEKLVALTDNQSLISLITNFLAQPDCSKEMVAKMISITIDRCLWSPLTTQKFAACVYIITRHDMYGTHIKHLVFNNLEDIYNSRSSLLTSLKYGPGTFRNCVDLTGEIYYRYRVSFKRLDVLSEPMIQYLWMLVTSSDPEDLAILCKHISWSGEELNERKPNCIDDLVVELHRLLIKPAGYTTTARYWILLSIDIVQSGFTPLSEKLSAFYADGLGEDKLASVHPKPQPFIEAFSPSPSSSFQIGDLKESA